VKEKENRQKVSVIQR